MQFDLTSVFRDDKEIPIDLSLNPTDYDNLESEYYDGAISVIGSFKKLDGIVTLQAECRYKYSAPCDRCASQVTKQYRVNIREKFTDKLEKEDNDDYILIPDMKACVDDIVVMSVLLSRPQKYLCKEDCKGLCSACGKNLNDGECECTAPKKDSRWDILSELLK